MIRLYRVASALVPPCKPRARALRILRVLRCYPRPSSARVVEGFITGAARHGLEFLLIDEYLYIVR